MKFEGSHKPVKGEALAALVAVEFCKERAIHSRRGLHTGSANFEGKGD
jgi:hypothetical protein